MPVGLDLEAAAVLGCAVLTAYGAVAHGAPVRPGDRVAVVAVGGVGQNIVQMARAFGGVQIIAVGRGQAKLDVAKRMGATDTVDSRATDPVERVRELTGGDGPDVAFEALGRPETFEQALAPSCSGSANSARTSVCSATAAANTGHRPVRTWSSRSGPSTGRRTRRPRCRRPHPG